MAGSKSVKAEDNKYVRLRVYSGLRLLLIVATISATFLFGFLIKHTNLSPSNVFFSPVGVIMAIVGGVIAFLPLTEEWVYAPWQDACQKCEKST